MTATSDAVIVATVRATGPERVVKFEGDDRVHLTDVTLSVDEVWYGQVDKELVTLEIDELFRGLPGMPPPRWLEPGQQSLLFVGKHRDRPDAYQPLNTQSIYRVDQAQDRLFATTGDDAFAAQVASIKIAEVRLRVVEAIPLIESGMIRPQRTLPLRGE